MFKPDDADETLAWENGDFSLDVSGSPDETFALGGAAARFVRRPESRLLSFQCPVWDG
jgi:hypothetical protein